jgi:hypothetical protein
MPDFGYAEDNYLLVNTGSKWATLSMLLGDKNRFSWLMNYIKLQQLEDEVRKKEKDLFDEK